MLKYKVWTQTYTNFLAPDCENTDDGWIQTWNLLLASDTTNLVIPRRVHDSNQSELRLLNDSDSSSSSDEGEDRVHGKQFKIQRVEKQNILSELTVDAF